MADERGVGGPHRRPSADIDQAVGIAGNHVGGPLAGAYLDDGAVLAGKSRDGAEGPRPEQDDVAARQLEETLDVGDVFRALGALPRHDPVEAELTAATDGAHGTDVVHRLPSRLRPPKDAGGLDGGLVPDPYYRRGGVHNESPTDSAKWFFPTRLKTPRGRERSRPPGRFSMPLPGAGPAVAHPRPA